MPRSRSTSSHASGVQRLPVNPRRHKVAPEQRKRVATACNSCNVKRVKCSGERPCRQCEAASRECIYPVAVDKVTIPRSELADLRAKCALLERCLQELEPDQTRRQQLFNFNTSPQRSPSISYDGSITPGTAGAPIGLGSPAASSTVGEAEEAQPPPEDGQLLQDTDGTARYLGVTSGATFLDSLKRFMSTIFPLAFNGGAIPNHGPGNTFLASVGRYQTSDSRPLRAPSGDPLLLPSPPEMSAKLDQLRYFIQDDGGVSGGVLFWGNLRSPPDVASMRAADRAALTTADLVAHRGMAFYHAAFAYSSLFGPTTTNSKQDGQLGETFFARARTLMGNPLEVSTYSSTDVATMALMSMYMVEMNRRDAAYMYITTAMHISIMHGIHRGFSVDEAGKRVFWTVYILDRWISCLMGRPPSIMDDVIRLDLPQDVPGFPSPIGIRAHIALSRISGHIVCNTHRIAPSPWGDAPTITTGASHVEKALAMLSEWMRDLPKELEMSYETFSQDRPLCTLHMTHNQLLILTIRPLFLNAVKRAVAQSWQQLGQTQDQQQNHADGSSPSSYRRLAGAPSRTRSAGIEEHHPQIGLFRECSDAARRNLRLGQWLAKITPADKLLLPDMHCVFNSAIMLLLHQIAFVDLLQSDVLSISFALEAFQREAAAGDTYATDCFRVMQDLACLVGRLRALMFDGVPHSPSPQFIQVGAVATPAASTSTSPPVAAEPRAGLMRGVPVKHQPPPSSRLEGHLPPTIPPYFHYSGYNEGNNGSSYNNPVATPGSEVVATGPNPGGGYHGMIPMMLAEVDMAPLPMHGDEAAYTELTAWLATDHMGDFYGTQFL